MLLSRMSSFLFSIKRWGALPTSEWQTESLPLSIRRRCSAISKTILTLAAKMIKEETIDYAVFCSEHGELNCTLKLLRDIAAKTILSPTSFSQSVHNTPAGLFSVMHHLHQDITTITDIENIFIAGIIEALTWLQLRPNKTVLLIIADEALPEIYRKKITIKHAEQYAVAFLLTNDEQHSKTFSLELSPHSLAITPKKKLLPAIEFLTWLTLPEKTLTQYTTHRIIKWHKIN